MSHFNPGPRTNINKPYDNAAARMEASKANFGAALMTSQSCMSKCNLNDASSKLS